MIIPTEKDIKENIFVLLNEYNFKKKYPEFYEKLTADSPIDLTFSEKLYWYFHRIDSHPICECGQKLSYKSFVKGYSSFCCLKCSRNSIVTQEKLKQTNLARYGVEFNSQCPDVKNKLKRTNLERYGSTCSLWNTDIQNKSLETKLRRYGNSHFTNHQKSRETKLKKYGDPDFTNPKKRI